MNITLPRPSTSSDDNPAGGDRTDGDRGTGAASDAGHVVAFVAVVGAVLVLLVLLLTLGVRWLAAEAATAASQRALEIAQAPDGTDGEARAVATGLATSVSLIAGVDVLVTRADDFVTVTVTAHDRLGGTVSRSATGPVIRFVPQTRPSP
ncbi:hypothetical protein Franean1_1364 [Parafrankia sp. EAN1pec]|uniref:hypothetical protein n=1 Tax=Parafrankia sp. (strain EAN1pec) TaxID=298653 RepID=UPI000054101F|nr:hypothetical protein Franean1_1364 [Frankia sp. EAN1pec]